ncbi:alanine/ornithine racemase family PLP-dependent enzyme [Alloalcanivorax xenomutans]|jgi:ornithine racemase|uniref:alanine/ornithine racemase family PLP-dependent enzyme n=1 Tax=Alloalcanivorax xenomutans TaxID=1094342 RepID=UPI0003B88871|nr:alanine/ornithine racemase family PLP-dependent enzyme [Alloalcanivorax xenomutans]ERS13580.1 alanine racemase [Alcanivorax sp. PN-3]PHS60553.1 MAG: alanine racemase [Alcanivorax sp.]WOA32693.1 alanine/ornithine racemase family PLP-dependent enzyme [Alloalcanivorax xenomutans]CUR45247.1 Ornithine racemase [Alloalcanivorax xenomutans]
MNAPRLEVDLDKITQNARLLVEELGENGITVTGVTKSCMGSVEVAKAMLRAGVNGLGDARIENIEAMRQQRIAAPIMLIRSPMLSQVERVVRHADISFNTELAVVRRLSAAAQLAERTHGVVLMVELGDLREGILPGDLVNAAREVLRLPNLVLTGIGTNLACHSGVAPDAANMADLSALADELEETLEVKLELVSGGNSANLDWALGAGRKGRVNHLRLGEAILLGRESLHRQPVDGLYTDAFALVAEVIESKIKPSLPWGTLGETAFGEGVTSMDRGDMARAILAIGEQDLDPDGLWPPEGLSILGASSDHLILNSGAHRLQVGGEVRFGVNYSALMRAMTSPFVHKAMVRGIKNKPGAVHSLHNRR